MGCAMGCHPGQQKGRSLETGPDLHFLWWRGFRTSTHLRATDPTKLMVRALPYAAAWAVALLNLGLGVPDPDKRPTSVPPSGTYL